MIHIYENPTELSQALAQFFAETAIASVKERGRFSVSLTGGNSPKELYRLLSVSPLKEEIPWSKTFIFWGDERCVPDADPQNNARMSYETLLDHVPVPAENIFRMNGTLPPAESAADYEDQLKAYFGKETAAFDLILLGMGDNAHTASLFPHTSVLHENTAWVKGLYIDEVKMDRITLTAPFINKARQIAFLLFGASKAKTLQEVLEGEHDIENKPVQLIKPVNGELHWFLDKAAASDLAPETIKK